MIDYEAILEESRKKHESKLEDIRNKCDSVPLRSLYGNLLSGTFIEIGDEIKYVISIRPKDNDFGLVEYCLSNGHLYPERNYVFEWLRPDLSETRTIPVWLDSTLLVLRDGEKI